MYENITERLNNNIRFDDASNELFEAVQKDPSLSSFKDESDVSDSSTNLDKQRIQTKLDSDKASLLHLLQEVLIQSNNKENLMHQECQTFISNYNSKGCLRQLVSSFSSFPRIVTVETIFLLQSSSPSILKDPNYQILLVSTAVKSPPHLHPLFCFPILQLLNLHACYDDFRVPPKQLPEEARDLLSDQIFSPITLANTLSYDKQDQTIRILKSFDIFSILLKQWISAAKHSFRRNALSCAFSEIQYFLTTFLRLYSKSLNVDTLLNRIIPLMTVIIRNEPTIFEQLMGVYNVFSQKPLDSKFSQVIPFAAASANSPSNAKIVLTQLTTTQGRHSPLLTVFFTQLRTSLSEIVSPSISEESQGALLLLHRLFKYIPYKQIDSLIKCFAEFQGLRSVDSEPPISVMLSFLTEFFISTTLAPEACKCLHYLSRYYPQEIKILFDLYSPIVSSSKARILHDMLDSSSKIVKALSGVAKSLLSYTYASHIDPPYFVTFLTLEYFPNSIFQSYEGNEERWTAFETLIDLSLDLSVCSPICCEKMQNSENQFASALIAIIKAGANSIITPYESNQPESKGIRADKDRLWNIIQFECTSLFLLQRLVTYNITKQKELSTLSKSFFSDKLEASSLFSLFASFLEVHHPLAADLRYYAIQMVSILCQVASKIPLISIDAFYPRDRQSVLVESFKKNLLESNVEQAKNELQFLSRALLYQPAFAFSFVRYLGSSFGITAASKIDSLAKETPELLNPLCTFYAQMWRCLKNGANSVKKIADVPDFWNKAKGIIEEKSTDPDMIASQAQLLRCYICSDENLPNDVFTKIIEQLAKVLPDDLEFCLHTPFSIKLENFENISVNKIYGENFYYNCNLLNRYLAAESEKDSLKFIDFIKKLNVLLSKVDACTLLINSLTTYMKAKQHPISLNLVLPLLAPIAECNFYPISSIESILSMIEYLIGQNSEVVPVLTRRIIVGLTRLLKNRPIQYAFTVISSLISVSYVNRDDRSELAELFDACIEFSFNSNRTSSEISAAINCATEAANILVQEGNWIMDNERIEILKEVFKTFIDTESGIPMLQMMTVILYNMNNSIYLEENHFFDILSNHSYKFYTKYSDPQWIYIFAMLKTVPQTAAAFVSNHIDSIDLFMKQAFDDTNSEVIMRIKASICQLFSTFGQSFNTLFRPNPTVADAILEMASKELHFSENNLRELSHIKMNGTMLDRDTQNQKLSHFLCLSSCLKMFSDMYDFPYGNLESVIKLETFHESKHVLQISQKILQTMSNLISKEKKIYHEYFLCCMEMASRIYIGQLITYYGRKMDENTHIDGFETTQRCIASAINTAKELENDDSVKYFESINDFLIKFI